MITIDLSNENIVHVKNDQIEYLQFRRLLEYKDVLEHCFTLKPLDFGSNNTYENQKNLVIQNYEKICNTLGIEYKNVIRPYQTHSNNVKVVDINMTFHGLDEVSVFPEEYKDVDGLITNQANKILSLTYADCTPLYLFDPVKKVIGNIHSGWLGTTRKIAKKAVEKIIGKYGCNSKDIICCIGPTIRKCHFEVDEDVKETFKTKFKFIDTEKFIYPSENIRGKYYIDTVYINKNILLEAGLKEENIIDSGICTVCNSERIYSYRGNNKTESRNTALMCLK